MDTIRPEKAGFEQKSQEMVKKVNSSKNSLK